MLESWDDKSRQSFNSFTSTSGGLLRPCDLVAGVSLEPLAGQLAARQWAPGLLSLSVTRRRSRHRRTKCFPAWPKGSRGAYRCLLEGLSGLWMGGQFGIQTKWICRQHVQTRYKTVRFRMQTSKLKPKRGSQGKLPLGPGYWIWRGKGLSLVLCDINLTSLERRFTVCWRG